jgi:hypothetical protein
MASSGMLRRVALVRINVSEELSASFIRVTKIGALGTTQAATSNRRTLRRNTKSHRRENLKSYSEVFYTVLGEVNSCSRNGLRGNLTSSCFEKE